MNVKKNAIFDLFSFKESDPVYCQVYYTVKNVSYVAIQGLEGSYKTCGH